MSAAIGYGGWDGRTAGIADILRAAAAGFRADDNEARAHEILTGLRATMASAGKRASKRDARGRYAHQGVLW